ncbi:MAG TPA: DUF4383 domain-containing protein [Actinomycetota bacterium]|nr:DUF4383 domain-containing protein [Actinomycetota bacterium]
MATYEPHDSRARRTDIHTHSSTTAESAVREPFGIAQAVALTLGVLFVVLGAVGLARAGLDELTRPAARVGPFTMTPLLSVIHLLIGVISLAAASGRAAARSTLTTLGPILIAVGIIAIIQPVRALGWNDATGLLHLIAGALALGAAIATPLVTTYRRRDTSSLQ